MNVRRIIGIVILLAGIAMLWFSNYIMTQVEEGKVQISEGQQKVDSANSLFSLRPETKALGKGLTGGGQKKINAGKEQVAEYEALAEKLKIGGWIVIAAGVVIIIIPRRKKK